MSKYRVRMTRDTSQSVDIEVEADTPEEAEQLAYTEARNNWDLPWEDDDYCSKPYCPDVEGDIELLSDI